jgi:hypothetical protein
MKKFILILCSILLVIALGYTYFMSKYRVDGQVIKTMTERKVLSFLRNEKYKVIEFNSKGYYQYKLTEEIIEKDPASWTFIENAKDYVGKNIEEHYAVVTSHPLQEKYPDKTINITILKSDGKIIGGISFCPTEDLNVFDLYGGESK